MINMITLFFDSINFVIIIGLLVYFFVRYGIPQLRDQKAQKRLLYDSLNAQKKELLAECATVKTEILAQQKFFDEMQSKIDVWQKSISYLHEHEYKKKELIQKKLLEKRALQSDNVSLHNAEQEVVPQAIVEARGRLEKIMHERLAAQAYTDKIIAFMRK